MFPVPETRAAATTPDLGDSAVAPASFPSLVFFQTFVSYLTYLSASLIVVKVHQADWVFRSLSALPPVLCIHKSSREGDAKVNVVGTAGPLWRIENDEIGGGERGAMGPQGVKINRAEVRIGEKPETDIIAALIAAETQLRIFLNNC